MKITLCLVAALLFVAPLGFAEENAGEPTPTPDETSRFSLGMYLGYWNVQDLDQFDGEGAFGGGVILHFRLQKYLGLELRGSGFTASRYEDVYIAGEGWYENWTSLYVLPLEAGLVAFLPVGNSVSFYAGPGIGYYFFDGDFISEQGPWSRIYDFDFDDDFGYYALLGVRAELASNIALFCEGKYTWVETRFDQEVDFLGIAREIDFSGFAFEAGMLFTF